MLIQNKCCGCENPFFLGCIAHCEEKLQLPVTASSAGVYTLFVDIGDAIITVGAKVFNAGESLVFDVSELNENYHYTNAYILDPNGDRVAHTVGDCEYNCFSFTRKIGISL